jgi:hypothetical protein
MADEASLRRTWIIAIVALATLVVAGIVILGGGDGDEASVQAVALAPQEQSSGAAGERAGGCEPVTGGCGARGSSEREPVPGPSATDGEESGEPSTAGAPTSTPSPAEPSDETSQQEVDGGAGDERSKPNRNPDHYGPGGEPRDESHLWIDEDDAPASSPVNVNPDHYGPGGEPQDESHLWIDEDDAPASSPVNVNPDE